VGISEKSEIAAERKARRAQVEAEHKARLEAAAVRRQSGGWS
jgi:hypothetical protein